MRTFATVQKRLAKFDGDSITVSNEPIDVEVLAEAKGYAMVRRPGAIPFVTPSRRLTNRTKKK